MRTPKILIVDGDENIRNLLSSNLKKERYDIELACDGKEALKLFNNMLPDVVLLDIMISKIDGWELCKHIRQRGDCIIIIISARSEVFDKILGLDLGADDYISKPFEVKEVLARIRACLRRAGRYDTNKIFRVEYDKLIIDIRDYKVFIDKKSVKMPPKEIELLFFLSSKPNRVFTRDTLLDELWGVECYVDARTVDVHIKRLREKLKKISDKWELKTVWGVGYKFETH